jgi:hypothetical protein
MTINQPAPWDSILPLPVASHVAAHTTRITIRRTRHIQYLVRRGFSFSSLMLNEHSNAVEHDLSEFVLCLDEAK